MCANGIYFCTYTGSLFLLWVATQDYSTGYMCFSSTLVQAKFHATQIVYNTLKLDHRVCTNPGASVHERGPSWRCGQSLKGN